jgi:hypothetical protein
MKFITVLGSVVLLFIALAPTYAKNDVVQRARATTYNMHSTDDLGDTTHCGATAIGPHALLSASHCEDPVSLIGVTGDDAATIYGTVRDGHDHTIFLLSTSFPAWATVSEKPLDIAERVFMFGSPGDLSNVYREGYVSGKSTGFTPAGDATLFDMNGYSGDSGSGIFNQTGQVVGVLSVALVESHQSSSNKEWTFKMMGAFSLAFTDAQLFQATGWKPGDAIPVTITPIKKKSEPDLFDDPNHKN